MPNQRFPIQRLPDDLCLEVLKTLNYYEMIAYSFVSKKAHSMIKSLRVETLSTSVELKKSLEIRWTTKDYGSTSFHLKLSDNDGESDSDEEPESEEIPQKKNDEEEIKTIKDLPSRVEVFTKGRSIGSEYLKWSNQGMSFEQWIQHLLSIFQEEEPIKMKVYLGEARLVIPSFRNTFPKIRKIFLTRNYNRLTDQDIIYAENLLKVFLPLVEYAHLHGVHLRKDFFVQHIGIVNLKELYIQSGQNLVLDDLLTLNVETLKIDDANQISLRDLNRFFKLWMKGSFPNLKEFLITKRTGIFPDWDVLLKGLRAEEPDPFKIFNARKAPQVQVVEPEEEPEEDSEDENEESEDVQEEEEEEESNKMEESEDEKEDQAVVEDVEAEESEEESEGAQEDAEDDEKEEDDKMEELNEDQEDEQDDVDEEEPESEPESEPQDEPEESEEEVEDEEDEVEWVEQPVEEPPGPTSMNVKIRNCHGVCADIGLQYISGMICYVRFFIRDPNETYAIWY